jgi:UDP-GlcNAc:undecaprenyl-phosphate GlcNAc-1-phosphate transferase
MSPELLAVSAFAIAAVATYVATPLAIALAVRTSFFDLPKDYKGHKAPTPYLGGTAIMIGVLAAVISVRGGVEDHDLLIAAALLIWFMGTVDDRLNLPILFRIGVEVGVAVLLWKSGRGWDVFGNGAADLALTVVWVVGVMNAFNLMDNMDGAAATVAAVSAVGAGVLALLAGDDALAPLSFAVAGACFGFLPRNLANPARIFMGDGGSLLLGLLVARVTMAAVNRSYLGPSGVLVAALLVGLVILDTTLVTISRTRGGRPLLTGGRDHLTHRLNRLLGSPRRVALTLAVSQLVVCSVTVAVARAGVAWVLVAGALGIVFAAALIWQLELRPWVPAPKPALEPAPEPASVGAGAILSVHSGLIRRSRGSHSRSAAPQPTAAISDEI